MFQHLDGHMIRPRPIYDRHDVRFIGVVPGRYALSGYCRIGRDGKIPIYACRLCSISTRLAVVVGPIIGDEGDRVTAHFDEFGILRGEIARKTEAGFVLNLTLTDTERTRLGSKIVWHKKRVHQQLPDKREHRRVVPRDPRTVLTLADGTQLPCFVIDMSRSGIAVSAEIWPDLGTPMAVGSLVGRVVRYLDVGFALQFMRLQDLAELDALIAPVMLI